MPREFSIYRLANGACVVKEEQGEPINGFADVLNAIAHVRKETKGQKAHVTVYETDGTVIFTREV